MVEYGNLNEEVLNTTVIANGETVSLQKMLDDNGEDVLKALYKVGYGMFDGPDVPPKLKKFIAWTDKSILVSVSNGLVTYIDKYPRNPE